MRWKDRSGERAAERDIIRCLRAAYLKDWHHWFAWYPVSAGGDVVWLEVVLRRYTWVVNGSGVGAEYRVHQ